MIDAPRGDGSSTIEPSREEIQEIQFWIDNPSLESNATLLNADDTSVLRSDVDFCRALLEKAGRGPVEAIGAGTFGVIFRGFDSRLNFPVAIKILRPSFRPAPRI